MKTVFEIEDRMTGPLMGMSKSLHTVISGMEELHAEMGKSPGMMAFGKAKNDLLEVDAQLRAIQSSQAAAASGQEQFNKSMQDGANESKRMSMNMSAVAKAAALVAGAVAGTKSFVGYSDEVARIRGRLNIVNDGLQTTTDLQNEIMKRAYETGGNYMQTADTVGRIGTVASGSFANVMEILDFAGELNKHFVIAGTSAMGIEAATTQITQAMSKGVFQGQELDTVLEQAPTMAKALAEHLGVAVGDLKKLGSEGVITASVFKDAMLGATAETAEAFNQIPWTITGGFRNRLVLAFQKAMQPAAEMFNHLVNSEKFISAFAGITKGIFAVGRAALAVVNITGAVFGFMYDHWDKLKYPVFALAAAIGVHLVLSFGSVVAAAIKAGIAMMLSLSPVHLGIMAVVAALVVVGLALHNVGYTATDVFGGIVGWLFKIRAIGENVLIFSYNLFGSTITNMKNGFNNFSYNVEKGFYNIKVSIVDMTSSGLHAIQNFVNGGLQGFANFANGAIDYINKIIGGVNSLGSIGPFKTNIATVGHVSAKRVNMTAGIDAVKANLTAPTKQEDEVFVPKEYKNLSEAYSDGKKTAEKAITGITEKVGSALNNTIFKTFKDDSKGAGLTSYGGNMAPSDELTDGKGRARDKSAGRKEASKVDKIAENTDDIKKALDIANEDLSSLRQYTEGRKITEINIENKIDMENIFHEATKADLDGFVGALSDELLANIDAGVSGLAPA